jgi:hypothetical protein
VGAVAIYMRASHPIIENHQGVLRMAANNAYSGDAETEGFNIRFNRMARCVVAGQMLWSTLAHGQSVLVRMPASIIILLLFSSRVSSPAQASDVHYFPPSPAEITARAALSPSLVQLLSISPRAASLLAEEDAWTHNSFASKTVADREIIGARARLLDMRRQQTAELLGRYYNLEEIRDKCVPLPLGLAAQEVAGSQCEVVAFGRVDNDPSLVYQIQEAPGDLSTGRTVVLYKDEAVGKPFHLAAWSDIETKQPSLAYAPFGVVLVLRSYAQGAAGRQWVENAYILDGPERVWREIDVSRIEPGIQARLPNGWSLNTAVTVNYSNAEATVAVMRPTDAYCCPTGGVVHASLTLASRVLSVQSMTVMPR